MASKRSIQELEDTLRENVVKTTITLDNRDLDSILEWVANNYTPEDVFSYKELDRWAESEGYIKADNQ